MLISIKVLIAGNTDKTMYLFQWLFLFIIKIKNKITILFMFYGI